MSCRSSIALSSRRTLRRGVRLHLDPQFWHMCDLGAVNPHRIQSLTQCVSVPTHPFLESELAHDPDDGDTNLPMKSSGCATRARDTSQTPAHRRQNASCSLDAASSQGSLLLRRHALIADIFIQVPCWAGCGLRLPALTPSSKSTLGGNAPSKEKITCVMASQSTR